ncbi:MAG: ethanolamine ammonia-lyase reactivating factor EutA [Intestinimonas sp.]
MATAGPDLESVLSARGAGTDKLSHEHRTTVANLDVGGGTTNIAVYEKGTLRGVCCLDIGGRLIKVDGGRITYLFHKIAGAGGGPRHQPQRGRPGRGAERSRKCL